MGWFWGKKEVQEPHVHHLHRFEGHFHNISKWIEHFHTTNKEIHKKHNDIIQYLHQMHTFVNELRHDNEKLRHKVHNLENSSISRAEIQRLVDEKEIIIDTEHIENKVLDKLKLHLPEPEEKIVEKTVEIPAKETVIERKEPKFETSNAQELSYSEKLVLNVLFSAESPLSYDSIGSRLNKKPGTIKVYVNNLKRKGIALEELNGPGNVKLYALTNKDKVKKLYNIMV